jgi:hypothetical protein
MAKTWYHGTPNAFEGFDPDWLGKGTDQLGSGYYFTDRVETARIYSFKGKNGEHVDEGYLLSCELDISKPLPEFAPVTRRQIEQIIRAAPDFVDTLRNFNDVDHYGVSKVLKEAVDTYECMNEDPEDVTLQMMFCLSNDFYRDAAAEFLTEFSRATGYDGLYREVRDGEIHAVVWDASRIEVVEKLVVFAEAAPAY